MLNKASLPWSVKQITKMISNGRISFENAVQRGYEWDKNRRITFIHSLIAGYPVPPVFARKGNDGVYDMLDGKQRLLTLKKFYDNEFALEGLEPIKAIIEGEEKTVDINGCYYENLLSDIRDDLDATSLVVYYFDGITEDEVSEMFFRLNNGKPVSSGTLVRVKALSKERIAKLGKHSVFEMSLTKKAMESYTNEDIVIKALYLLSGHNDLEMKHIKEWVWSTEIDDDLEFKLYSAMSRIETIAKMLNKDEETKKIAKKILTKTHFLSLLPVMAKANEEKIKDDPIKDFIVNFYNADGVASISSKYNEACGSGSSKKEAVTTRFSVLEKNYNKFAKAK